MATENGSQESRSASPGEVADSVADRRAGPGDRGGGQRLASGGNERAAASGADARHVESIGVHRGDQRLGAGAGAVRQQRSARTPPGDPEGLQARHRSLQQVTASVTALRKDTEALASSADVTAAAT